MRGVEVFTSGTPEIYSNLFLQTFCTSGADRLMASFIRQEHQVSLKESKIWLPVSQLDKSDRQAMHAI